MTISFLIGAGFSNPAGYPLAKGINSRFINFKPSDIIIESNVFARFTEENENNIKDEEALKTANMFSSVINFYCDNIIVRENFHYEDFFDWYKSVQFGEKKYDYFEKLQPDTYHNVNSLMVNFDILFNQLLKSLLMKNLPVKQIPQTYLNLYHLINHLSEYATVNIHSLNHDLLFESFNFNKNVSDGFSDIGTDYFGELFVPDENSNKAIFRNYHVKLPYFINKFDAPINFYKLHGSIDHYVDQRTENVTLKTMYGIGQNNLYRETKNDQADIGYEVLGGIFNPTFLTGTNFKKSMYNSTRYLTTIFQHFEENLQNSQVLIVIGYGFKDEKINELLREHFSNRDNLKMYVIDMRDPGVDYEYKFFERGVSNFDHNLLFDDILENCPELQRAIEEEKNRISQIKV